MKGKERIQNLARENAKKYSIEDLRKVIEFQNIYVSELMKMLDEKLEIELSKGEDIPF